MTRTYDISPEELRSLADDVEGLDKAAKAATARLNGNTYEVIIAEDQGIWSAVIQTEQDKHYGSVDDLLEGIEEDLEGFEALVYWLRKQADQPTESHSEYVISVISKDAADALEEMKLPEDRERIDALEALGNSDLDKLDLSLTLESGNPTVESLIESLVSAGNDILEDTEVPA